MIKNHIVLWFYLFEIKICLDAQQGIESNEINKWKEVYDLPQQQKIREDCQTLAGNFF